MKSIGQDLASWTPDAAGSFFDDHRHVNTIDHEADAAGRDLLPRGFLEWFVVAQTALPALLFLPGFQALRVPIRVGAYATALVGFAIWWMRGSRRPAGRHPAESWLVLVALCLFLMIFHPLTNSPLAGVAQVLLYCSVFCSLFWAPAYVSQPRDLVRILVILLVCNGLNSMVGVLQVYDPARWMPAQLSAAFAGDVNRFIGSTYVGPDGLRIIRPPGLFDTPGAVCGAGTLAAFLGLVFACDRLVWWKRLAAVTFGIAGVSAIYLSHVRSSLVVLFVMMLTYALVLLLQGERRRLMRFSSAGVGLVLLGLTAAVALGGESIEQRFSTLFQEDPRDLYYVNRGSQLAYAFESLAVEYPGGAGLGRWGLIRDYFGDPSNLDSSAIWAEVQPSAWILDGGWLLLALCPAALLLMLFQAWRVVRSHDAESRSCAAVVLAANVGTVALIFAFTPFTNQIGLQFWFLSGALHGATAHRVFR